VQNMHFKLRIGSGLREPTLTCTSDTERVAHVILPNDTSASFRYATTAAHPLHALAFPSLWQDNALALCLHQLAS